MSKSNVKIGTSGFSYKDWLGNFYPQFCPAADFLRFYASVFKTVEIDATFYRIPAADAVTKWAKTTPDDFTFAAKFPRAVTHEGEDAARVDTALAFVKIMKNLGGKLGPLLLQFPYSFKPDQLPLLKRIIDSLPEKGRFAVELRNKTWLENEAMFKLLSDKNVALCLIDHPWMPRMDTATADFSYIRFLGDRKKIENDFSYERSDRQEDLDWWRGTISKLLAEGGDLYAFFNNHYTGHSPSAARRMIEMLQAKA